MWIVVLWFNIGNSNIGYKNKIFSFVFHFIQNVTFKSYVLMYLFIYTALSHWSTINNVSSEVYTALSQLRELCILNTHTTHNSSAAPAFSRAAEAIYRKLFRRKNSQIIFESVYQQKEITVSPKFDCINFILLVILLDFFWYAVGTRSSVHVIKCETLFWQDSLLRSSRVFLSVQFCIPTEQGFRLSHWMFPDFLEFFLIKV